MIMRKLLAVHITLLFLSASLFGQTQIVGTWITPEKDAHIEIYDCGSSTFCGKIVWLKEPNNADGTPRTDVNNEDAAKQKTPLMGMDIMKGFKYDADEKEWNGGTVYDSRGGKTYSGYLKMQADGKLFMKGYIYGMRWLGRSNLWTRVK